MHNLTITGARLHNLKRIDVSIPKNKLVVVTGVSGSGKSSLVFDLIFEEGRRQYLQSLGVLSGLEDESKFDTISGIAPTIAVQQSIIRQSNPRSTVGSRTRLLHMLGVLYAWEGQILCRSCATPVGEDLTCRSCGNTEERLEARCFSHNAPDGMCLKCSGRGAYHELDLNKLVLDDRTTLKEVFDSVGMTPGYARLLLKYFGDYINTPFSKLPDDVKEDVIHGHYLDSNAQRRSYCLMRIFEGRLFKYGEDPSGVYTLRVCSDCRGFRIGEEARRVLLNARHIGELGRLTLTETKDFFEALLKQESFTPLGTNLLKEILRRTNALLGSRLGHLSLYREMSTLSGGEVQRLFLNIHLDSRMDSLIYILDEPTIGLHESEKAELLHAITELKELGNTVIVVEHDRNTIALADHIIDIGPGAGSEGGRVVYQGNLAGLLECEDSITGQYLSGRASLPVRNVDGGLVGDEASGKTTLERTTPSLTLRHARTHNLQDVTVSFPLGVLVGIAGVSGSGKSSLISHTLVPLLKEQFRDAVKPSVTRDEGDEADGGIESAIVETVADRLDGVEHLSGFAEVSQAPIGRHLNSNPVTYIGIWDRIRKLFARQPEAIERKLSAGHFSFNSKGACSACGGSGRETIWLGGTLKMSTRCKECNGKRYNDEARSVRYQGKTIVDVLEMRVSEAIAFFEDKGILSTLQVMDRIGMAYIELGQPTPSLSGGESQRIKLAKEIGRRRKGNILYVLDEPTTGLSPYDTAKLIDLLDELVAGGNSAIVVEHDPVLLSSCDWIIELGPEGGAGGGRIIAEGTPQSLRNNPASRTGQYLRGAR